MDTGIGSDCKNIKFWNFRTHDDKTNFLHSWFKGSIGKFIGKYFSSIAELVRGKKIFPPVSIN